MSRQKVQKLAAFINIMLKAIAILLSAAIIVLLLAHPKQILSAKIESVGDGVLHFMIQNTFSDGGNQNTQEMWLLIIVAAFSASLLITILWLASKIFKDLAIHFLPFQEKNVRRLRIISLLLLAYSLVPELLYSLLYTLFLPGWLFWCGLDETFLFAIIFFCLTEVFRYGANLQKESDETF